MTTANSPKTDWLDRLKKAVEDAPIVLIALDHDEWDALHRFDRDTFSIARPHRDFEKMDGGARLSIFVPPAGNSEQSAYAGVAGKKVAVATTHSRVHFRRLCKFQPSLKHIVDRLPEQHVGTLGQKLSAATPVVLLAPKLSIAFIDVLAADSLNTRNLQSVAAALRPRNRIRGNAEFQENAVHTALRAFGLPADPIPTSVSVKPGATSALAGLQTVPLMEDRVIEHDARSIEGYALDHSDITGRATFQNAKAERLEVITANRGALEEAFGVDLIYLNHRHHNMVMLQYKMLNRTGPGDWVFRPDGQLEEELARMRKFANAHLPAVAGYRFNPSAFYLKFVQRDGALRKAGLIMPLDHYESYLKNPAAKGPNGGLRVSYNALDGSYMREAPFIELISAGYIGSHAETTEQLKILVEAVLKAGGAVVAAIQSQAATPRDEGADDELPFEEDDED
jgi:hypothetical protein